MAKVFDIQNNNVFITPEALTIQVFKEIYDKDKSKNKDEASSIIAFIYHTCDPNSPYSDTPLEERDDRVIEEVCTKKFKITPEIDEARDIYKSLIITPLEELLESTKSSIMDISNFLKEKSEDPDTLKIKLDMMSKFSKFIAEFQALEKVVKKEREAAKGRVKGGQEIEDKYNA